MCGPARCETAPVWDVGPWNTHDDHWNPPAQREQWKDLPRGLPQAQAAYENGYNGGRDEFGRQGRQSGRHRPGRRNASTTSASTTTAG
ncbi:hypothetical protein LV779_08430 [Streptomyces thinghirensis]|nr:hypothetical protein [Streptomyces thinghirensis]